MTYARLISSISANTNVINVRSITPKPNATPDAWLFINSKDLNGNGYSDSTEDYIFRVRINDEIMKITSNPTVNNGIITLNVDKGYYGIKAVFHNSESRVFSPAHIGNKNSAPSDLGLSGIPSRNELNQSLRYGIKILRPEGYNWIAKQIKETFGINFSGFNTIHFDVLSCTQYYNATYDGNTVFNWDDNNSIKMTTDQ